MKDAIHLPIALSPKVAHVNGLLLLRFHGVSWSESGLETTVFDSQAQVHPADFPSTNQWIYGLTFPYVKNQDKYRSMKIPSKISISNQKPTHLRYTCAQLWIIKPKQRMFDISHTVIRSKSQAPKPNRTSTDRDQNPTSRSFRSECFRRLGNLGLIAHPPIGGFHTRFSTAQLQSDAAEHREPKQCRYLAWGN